MIRNIIIYMLLFFGTATFTKGQELPKNQAQKQSMLLDIRSNSRDIAPVRRTNLHQRSALRVSKAIKNTNRAELRTKRALYQKQKMMQNRKKMMMRNKMIRRKAIQRKKG